MKLLKINGNMTLSRCSNSFI